MTSMGRPLHFAEFLEANKLAHVQEAEVRAYFPAEASSDICRTGRVALSP
jgi:hypothetical protein